MEVSKLLVAPGLRQPARLARSAAAADGFPGDAAWRSASACADFSLAGAQAALAFAGGLGAQLFWLQVLGLRGVGLRSALITCFGIVLLLRRRPLAAPVQAARAISAKFVLRVRGRHLWNPANFGVVLALVLFPGAWASPGQWGQDLALALWFVALGGLVSLRARSSDLAWTFLLAFLGLVALRAWLGQSWAIWWHQLGNGALLLFAFFMIRTR